WGCGNHGSWWFDIHTGERGQAALGTSASPAGGCSPSPSCGRSRVRRRAPRLLTCAVLTAAANDMVKPVHGRMSSILPPESYAAWIDRDRQEVADLLRPLPAGLMEAFPVSPAVNEPRHEGPECLAVPHSIRLSWEGRLS